MMVVKTAMKSHWRKMWQWGPEASGKADKGWHIKKKKIFLSN